MLANRALLESQQVASASILRDSVSLTILFKVPSKSLRACQATSLIFRLVHPKFLETDRKVMQ